MGHEAPVDTLAASSERLVETSTNTAGAENHGAPMNEETPTGPALGNDDEIRAALGAGRRRRRLPWLLVGVAVGVGGTIATSQFLTTDDGTDDAVRTETVELTTATVTTQDLVDSVEYEADLGRGTTQSLLAGADGTVTSIVNVGDGLDRGDIIATVDTRPVVAMYGTQPFWRDLQSGDEGTDVLQLEANLAALGFTADGAMTVDLEYTSATVDAVEAWEESLGLESTGDVPLGRAVVINGPSVVSEASDVGSEARAGQQLVLVEPEATAIDLTIDGAALDDDVVLTSPVPVGTPIGQGTTLALLDGIAVQAVTETSIVSQPILDAIGDENMVQLENLLVFFGFDPSGAVVVDDEADLATIAAIAAWQTSIGLQPTGVGDAAYYVEVPAGLVVSSVHATADADLDGGALLATATAPTLVVSLDVVVDEIDNFTIGQAVEIELADESVLTGQVATIADVATEAATVDEVPTVAVEIALDDVPDDVVLGPVTVRVESGRISDAVLVPTRALVSLREGGFAVSVRRADGSDELVGIELGTIDDGLAEVLSGDVSPGDEVVVPS
jgi:peptidoglycan hydrolase-like protein with peptidoglycan-binding domain